MNEAGYGRGADYGNVGNGYDVLRQIPEGTTVYDVNGEKIGTASGFDSQTNSLIIQKGLFFPKDIAVPMSAISGADSNGVYLAVTKEDANNGNWGSANRSNAAYTAGNQGENRLGAAQSAGWSGTSNDRRTDPSASARSGDVTIPVREEELVADKQQGEIGNVRVSKDVVTEQQNISVPVRHEEVTVERVPVDDRSATDVGPDAFQEDTIDVPVKGEQLNVSKQARVSEEVRLHKQEVTDQRRVGDTVRKEEVHVDEPNEQGRPGGFT